MSIIILDEMMIYNSFYLDNEDWEKFFAALQTYHKDFGNCNVPQSATANSPDGSTLNLGKW